MATNYQKQRNKRKKQVVLTESTSIKLTALRRNNPKFNLSLLVDFAIQDHYKEVFGSK